MEDGIWDIRRAPGAAIFHLPSSIFSSLATRCVERNATAMQKQSADKSAHRRIFEGNRCGDKKNRLEQSLGLASALGRRPPTIGAQLCPDFSAGNHSTIWSARRSNRSS